jgi:hypothetical protein
METTVKGTGIHALVALTVAFATQSARADEGGVSFYLPGSFGSLAATSGVPGWSWARSTVTPTSLRVPASNSPVAAASMSASAGRAISSLVARPTFSRRRCSPTTAANTARKFTAGAVSFGVIFDRDEASSMCGHVCCSSESGSKIRVLASAAMVFGRRPARGSSSQTGASNHALGTHRL